MKILPNSLFLTFFLFVARVFYYFKIGENIEEQRQWHGDQMSPYRVNLSKRRWICLNCYIYFFIASNVIFFIVTIMAITYDGDFELFQLLIDIIDIIFAVE